jgi:hypothetical protein
MMDLARRALPIAALLTIIAAAASGQERSVLHIRATLLDADGKPTPVAGHALLISDEPPSAAPRRIVTNADGAANVSIRPGRYTVESDQPLVARGQAYTWTEHIVIVSGRDMDLVLGVDNAAIETTNAADTSVAPPEPDRLRSVRQSPESVVVIWTPTSFGSGFLVDASGLIATTRSIANTPSAMEVQLPSGIKVAARLVATDAMRNVAILRVDPAVVRTMRPAGSPCGTTTSSATHQLVTDGIQLQGLRRLTSGQTDIDVEALCELLPLAQQQLAEAAPPPATHLPVEPSQNFSVADLAAAARTRAGSLTPSRISSSDFDVTFITPLQVYAALEGSAARRQLGRTVAPPLFDFGNWAEYVADYPRVLLVRVTPKMVESFWTTVGRVAARTQGMDLPPLTHVKTGFARLRLFCGDAEVPPIHPFTIEQPVSEKESVSEGLYVFDPDAIGPQCRSVKLTLYSEKEPGKGDDRTVEMSIITQLSQDFITLGK